MKNKLSIHQYVMRSRGSLNAKSVRCVHRGALVRVDHEEGVGYGCIHPWPELGDKDLDQILTMLPTTR